MSLRVLSIGKHVFTGHDGERVWGDMSLRVLSMGRRVFTCHDEEGIWESVHLRVMTRRGYRKAGLYVF